MSKCAYAKYYKGADRPICLDGHGCDFCRDLYKKVHAEKKAMWAAEDRDRAERKARAMGMNVGW